MTSPRGSGLTSRSNISRSETSTHQMIEPRNLVQSPQTYVVSAAGYNTRYTLASIRGTDSSRHLFFYCCLNVQRYFFLYYPFLFFLEHLKHCFLRHLPGKNESNFEYFILKTGSNYQFRTTREACTITSIIWYRRSPETPCFFSLFLCTAACSSTIYCCIVSQIIYLVCHIYMNDLLSFLGPQPSFGDKLCPQNWTAVLKNMKKAHTFRGTPHVRKLGLSIVLTAASGTPHPKPLLAHTYNCLIIA